MAHDLENYDLTPDMPTYKVKNFDPDAWTAAYEDPYDIIENDFINDLYSPKYIPIESIIKYENGNKHFSLIDYRIISRDNYDKKHDDEYDIIYANITKRILQYAKFRNKETVNHRMLLNGKKDNKGLDVFIDVMKKDKLGKKILKNILFKMIKNKPLRTYSGWQDIGLKRVFTLVNENDFIHFIIKNVHLSDKEMTEFLDPLLKGLNIYKKSMLLANQHRTKLPSVVTKKINTYLDRFGKSKSKRTSKKRKSKSKGSRRSKHKSKK